MKFLVSVLSVAVVSISLAQANSIPKASNTSFTGENLSVTGLNLREFNQDYTSIMGQDNCFNHSVMAQPNVMVFVEKIKEATKTFCEPSNKSSALTRFAPADCTKASTCRNSLGKNDDNRKDSDAIVNSVIAKDYITNSISMYGEDMERLEGLTKFAQKQYDTKLGKQCVDRFKRKADYAQCNFGFAEETFVNNQKTCPGGYGCFKTADKDSGVSNFDTFRDSHKNFDGKYMYEYYKYRVETKFTSQVNSDENNLASLGELVASAKFKALSLDAKVARFTAEVGMENDGRLKDPVLGYDMGSGSKDVKRFLTSDKFKDVLKLLQDKNVTAKSFAKDFDEIRKNRATALLTSKDVCVSTPTFISICSDATKILNGKAIKKNSNFADHISSPQIKDDTSVERLKKILGKDFSDNYFETLVNARRCIAFGLSDEKGNAIDKKDNTTTASGKSDHTSVSEAEEMELRGESPPQVSVTALKDPDMKGVWNDAVSKANGSKEVIADTAEKGTTSPESDSSFGKIEPISGNIPGANPAAANNYNDLFNTSGFDTFAGKDKTKVDEAAGKSESASDAPAGKGITQDSKTTDLMKRLSTAEENLEKLKAENELAEQDRAKQKKIDEETALIKDLKGQISELKTQSAKNTAKKIAEESAVDTKAQSFSRNSNSSPAIISGARANESAAPAAVAENYEGNRSAVAAEASRSNSGSSSVAVLSSVTNTDGSKTSTLASGMVVTTVDGMTAENAAITISNRIFELNGTPFYIEEGGVVKEIIAIVKNGKVLLDEKGNPVFEKIVKGKVGDKKFAKNKDKDRAPASITNVADLKRDQEEKLKRERAEYMKLKNLTNDALKKK